jgi:hypothetical protein
MAPTEEVTHSFIVRIWLEEMAVADQPDKWRGHITHVPSGQRQYLEKIETITEFIAPYLKINQN